MRNPDEETRRELLRAGTECQVPGCTVIVQRTQDGTIADGMRAHETVCHPGGE